MTSKKKQDSIFQTSLHNFNTTANRLGLSPALAQTIAAPKETVQINLNPILPDGKITNLSAFIVRHNDALGPAKGGIRMTPSVTIDDVTGLAMEMTWKTSLIGVPFGGGKAGIRLDTTNLSLDAKEVVVRSFTRGAHRHIGPEIYIPAPDMGTNETDMGHIRDCISYSAGTSITDGCFVTGKPVILSGIVGRREATGHGVVHTIVAACEKLGLDIKTARVVVQGFGNVGAVTANALASLGAKIIAIADLYGAIADNNGLDIPALNKYVSTSTAGVKGFPNAAAMDPSDIFALECDILVPAASGSQITAKNAPAIKARIIAEGANAPTTPDADQLLNQRDIFLIPDILCNAGGVFVSYLEYAQETQREQMTLAIVEQRLRQRMIDRFNQVYDLAQHDNLPMRHAAMNLAVGRVVDAVTARGFHP